MLDDNSEKSHEVFTSYTRENLEGVTCDKLIQGARREISYVQIGISHFIIFIQGGGEEQKFHKWIFLKMFFQGYRRRYDDS